MAARTNQKDSQAQRRTRATLKELLLEAGAEVLERDGLGFNTDTVTYKTVFAHLEESQGIRVTRGSVHERIWDRQRDFQMEILQRAIKWTPAATDDDLIKAATEVLDRAELDTEAGRWQAAEDLVRDAAKAVYVTSDADDHWPQWIGLTLALAGPGNRDIPESKLMIDSARESYDRRNAELCTIYAGFLAATRMRIRQDLFSDAEEGLRVMTRLITAVADGLALREQFDPKAANPVALRSEEGGPESWHPFSLGAWAIVRFFLEPIAADEEA